jgi:putative transposase
MHDRGAMPEGAPRIVGFDYVGGYWYSLTICTYSRRSLFVDAGLVRAVLEKILQAAAVERFAVIAYCFMPDHLHLLVAGITDRADLRKFVKRWKQVTGYWYGQQNRQRLWQVGYFDHVLRSDESAERHAQYIVANPVRAGLSNTVGEYPFAEILGAPEA